MIPAPVLNAGFLQFGISAFTMHDALFPPIGPKAVPLPGLVEGPAFMGWPPGIVSHKKAYNVIVEGNPGIQEGHDIGYLIPHVGLPPNLYSVVNMAISKHKLMFSVSRVELQGKAVGTYLFAFLGQICCQPVGLPTGVVALLKCTVWTSLAPIDVVRGIVAIAADVLLDVVWKTDRVKNCLPKWFKETKLPSFFGKETAKALGGRFLVGVVARLIPNKIVHHVLKSFIVSPIVTGLPLGKVGLGRGGWAWSHKFFSW